MRQKKAMETKRDEEQRWVMPLTNKAAAIPLSLVLASRAASGHGRRYHWILDPNCIEAIREQK